jgi:hypothetical protein
MVSNTDFMGLPQGNIPSEHYSLADFMEKKRIENLAKKISQSTWNPGKEKNDKFILE